MENLIIAVDGPSGAGKSTVSKALAGRLGLTYIDTGAMYRAVALKSKEEGIGMDDSAALAGLAQNSDISFRTIGDKNCIYLDGRDVSDLIRAPEISLLTSRVSSVPEVRKALVSMQRKIGNNESVIMDGRDIGTVVFPDADFKFYIDADIRVRGRRRHLELQEKGGLTSDLASTTREISERDMADTQREAAPLKMADDAIYVETTDLSVAEVVEKLERIILSGRKP